MDKKALAGGIAMLLLGVGLAGLFPQMPRWLGLLFCLAALPLLWYACSDWLRLKMLRIEDFPVSNALNLKITNARVASGLGGSELTLHALSQWRNDRRDFGPVGSFPFYTPQVLYSDKLGLPINEPRMFQIAEFVNKVAPIIRGKFNGQMMELPIPTHGIFRVDMEMRWGGGMMPIVRYFRWDEKSLPTFCKRPR